MITNNSGRTAQVAVVRAPQDPTTAAQDQQQQIEHQIVQWFRQYMGRDPRPDEMPLWTAQVTERGKSLFDVQADLLANPQVWHRCQHDEARYVQLLFEKITGRKPTQDQLDFWVWKMQQSGGLRREIAEDFLVDAGVPR